jgi:hypothetical protein
MCNPMSDLDKFYLERTTTALYDAGSASSRSVLLFIALYAASALVLFVPVSSTVKVDALGIELPRIYAGEVLLVLACAALYQHFTLLFSEVLLRDKLENHLTEAGGAESDEWFLRYPSLAHFHGIMAPSIGGRTYVIAAILDRVLMTGALVYPLLALVQIGRTTHWSAGFAGTALLCVLLLISSVLISARMNTSTVDALERLATRAASTTATASVDRAVSRWMKIVGGTLLFLTGLLADEIGWGMRPGVGVLQISAIVIGGCFIASALPDLFRKVTSPPR